MMKMKSIPAVFLALLFLLCCGCGKTAEGAAGNHEETSGASDEALEALMDVFQTPVQFASIDLTADDPSNDVIRFEYDEQGRINTCTYEIEDKLVVAVYSYKEQTVNITTLISNWIVADETIELPGDYDPVLGFSAVQGYYIKGYAF